MCGPTEELTRVEEPSRCEYTARLRTPAACTHEHAAELRAELARRVALLEGGAGAGDAEGGPPKDEL